MRFTKLRLSGFKSFVDPTEMVISEGLTGVVGPNGCGKSNLLEALRWVMGENRPTAMRGSGMEDVIFSGSSTRPARNFAEVTLQIDNHERRAPAVFNQTEQFDIVRRITRDIGSAYRVGGKEVRARDVHMLFADAASGAHSSALVRQGQITELINAKPKARRRVLEEAAGISGLYQRRHEAELKLKSAETNLARVDDVIEQLATQLTQLAKQAKEAARYRSISEKLRLEEARLSYRNWRDAHQSFANQELKWRDAERATVRQEAQARATIKEREEASEKLIPLREEETIAAAVLQRVIIARETLVTEIKQAKDKIQSLTQSLAQLERDADRETELNKDAEDTLNALSREAAELEDTSEAINQEIVLWQDKITSATDAANTADAEVSAGSEHVATLLAQHESVNRMRSDLQRTQERITFDAEKSQKASAAARAAHDIATQKLTLLTAQDRKAHESLEAAEAALSSVEEKRPMLEEKANAARALKAEKDGAAAALAAEITGLERILAQQTARNDAVLDHITVAPGYEQALGAAISDDLQMPLTSSYDKSGWVDLQNHIKHTSLPLGIMCLVDLVVAPQALANRLRHIGICSAAQAEALHSSLMPGQRLVTQDGALWRWDGFYRAHGDAANTAALQLQQKNRLNGLQAQMEVLQGEAADARHLYQTCSELMKVQAETEKAARQERREADAFRTQTARTLSAIESEIANLADRAKRHEDETRHFEEEITKIAIKLETALEDKSRLPPVDDSKATLEGAKLRANALRASLIEARGTFEEAKRTALARQKRSAKIVQERQSWHARLSSATERGNDLQKRRAALEEQLSRSQNIPAELDQKIANLATQIDNAEKRSKEARDALAAGEAAQHQRAQREREAERDAADARAHQAAQEARYEAARDAVQQVTTRVLGDMGIQPDTILDHFQIDPDNMPLVTKIEAEIAGLKRQRESIGPVNLRAEEDAKDVEHEHVTLVQEKDDLAGAIGELRGGISSLNKEGRGRLLAAFEEVNSNFRKLFTHLFGGGEANLVMVESEDPLDAGLEILCQPPGKKLSTLSLLSGGEQTLTAMALILAIFLANPAPICVLDEVDAPLDDANVTRFCDLLDEMTRHTKTRFLVITHHAVTMARMDRLFGVTMQEKGVSQLVSVDLNAAEKLVA